MALKRHGLAQRRRTVGLTQEGLAEALHVERSTVARWESGNAAPQPWIRPRLAELLHVSIEGLGELLALTSHGGQPDVAGHTGYAMRYPSRVDLSVVAELRDRMDFLGGSYDRVPSATLLVRAAEHVSKVAFLAEEAPAGRVQREMRILQADAATFMGQLVWDASQRRDHETARSYYAESVEMARHLGDRNAEGRALLRTCHVALYGAGDFREGLDLALRAARTTRYTSDVLAGLAMLHAAEAYAFLGEAEDCERALEDAERHLADAHSSDAAHELLSPTHFGRLAGSCYLSLGDYRKAERLLAQTAAELLDRRKSRAIVLGNLSLARLRDGNLDAALAAFNDAVSELHGTRGGGGMNIAFRAAREMRAWRSETAVLDAQDRLMALMEAT
ncbi:helix-turn-helix domain-containing protein [Streptomyces europaeiscabiei]|uniref:Helix-turn-helix transcriptional regulator n=1 Tax=Streptomyces europaeiscabiei TaxID=146819 RepID=A0ABU4NVQ6_9ACTN|nr:helix-turn-helix transcriptional regulator [Streptomyces europaeiscabiei]MDX2530389.1 helix-turn-helix transcriptional regulator [Streptomyces europaeiscabiei]MDX2765354.1 helix-turn-helix transcriptional regulator [Streptomyces europaeiscabiei]MDX3549012.1 helix-turn-helix transcriptional regulator [Streptomyces europaeiscabiei]MDX3555383.1 helix-turn-helix transcriptional regulator [Streptomyces europaeiscabiei]MDX3668386.1 helix-turn-helix transcriptional regulator [Streptomyces europaei